MPEKPILQQIAEEIVEGLKTIGHDETKWRTKPATVDMSVVGTDFTRARPAVFVLASGSPESEPGTADQWWEEEVRLKIVCMSESPANAHGAIHDLVADVRQWLRENVRLSCLDSNGALYERGFEFWLEKADGRAGIGVAVVNAVVQMVTKDSTELA